MTERKIEILWTKNGDGTPHQRKRTLSVMVPVELHVETLGATNMTPELIDAVLSLPSDPRPCNTYGVSLTVPRDDLTNDDVIEIAIPQLRAEIEAAERKEVEKEEAFLAEQRVKLATFACGGDDPGYPLTERRAVDWLVPTLHHNLDKVAVEHVVVSHGVEAMEGHDELRVQVEARMEMINAGARERAKAELVDKETAQTKREQLNAEKEAAKLANAEKRAAEIKAWAAKHGSTRLQEQIGVGFDGWPLYLHERLDADFGSDAELDNDGTDGDEVINPTEAQLAIARKVAARAVELGLCETVAFKQIEIVQIKFERDEDDHGCDPNRKVYVTFSGYRPGSEAFATKTIRFLADDTVRVRLGQHCEE